METLDDELYKDACKVAKEMGYASTSLFWRRLRCGYAQAAQILDAMETLGFCEMANPNARDKTRRKLL